MNDAIKTVGVLGLGVMGFDIAFLNDRGRKPGQTNDLEAGASMEAVDGVAKQLHAVTDQGQRFYEDRQSNPWAPAFVERSGHARH